MESLVGKVICGHQLWPAVRHWSTHGGQWMKTSRSATMLHQSYLQIWIIHFILYIPILPYSSSVQAFLHQFRTMKSPRGYILEYWPLRSSANLAIRHQNHQNGFLQLLSSRLSTTLLSTTDYPFNYPSLDYPLITLLSDQQSLSIRHSYSPPSIIS